MDDNLFNKITPSLIKDYQERLRRELKLSPATIDRKLSSLRRFCAWAERENYLEESPFGPQIERIPDIKITAECAKYKLTKK